MKDTVHSTCFHCHESIPEGIDIHANINGKQHKMCCHGCKAVAEFISDEGYCDFYDYRGDSKPANKAEIAQKKWLQYDESVSFKTFSKQLKDSTYQVSIRLEGMYCSACGWLIDKHLRQLEGINEVKLNSITKIVRVEFDLKKIKLSQILTALNFLGYKPIVSHEQDSQEIVSQERKNALKRLIVSGLGMMFIMTLSVPLYSGEYNGIDPQIRRFFELVSLLVATVVFFYAGSAFIQNAIRDLRNKHLGMDVPVALSISLAYGVSVWNVFTHSGHTIYFDSMVMFVFFLLAGRFVEMSVRHQGMSSTDALGSMIPTSIAVLRGEKFQNIPLDNVVKGDVICVEESQTIALDGVIIDGNAKVDESMITGESIAVNRTTGDHVMAGSQIQTGSIRIKSTAIGNDTILANLSNLLENAQLQKPKTLLLVDKIASWFVAIVLILAALTAIYYAIYNPDKTLVTVLAVLVATCPCALSLATPAALTAASVRLMKSGILINNLDAISGIAKVKHWFFDKTGTLTESSMSIAKVYQLSDIPKKVLLKIAASLEHNSTHPIASAFNDYYDENIEIEQFIEKSDSGLQALVNGDDWKIGSLNWCAQEFDKVITSKKVLTYLSRNNKVVAVFELENKIRKGSIELISHLKENDNYVAIISGDKEAAVTIVARMLRIGQYLGEKSPEQKINIIKYHQDQGFKTVMLGDGVNDAPVLAQSDVSISFNQGTQLARSASDLILMGNSLSSIEDLLKISHKTNRIIKQNIIWALVYNLSVTPLAMMGYLTPWMAAIGMSVSSLFVILNAKRILIKPKF
jgi:Cu2+-exporting ATPase